jgi:hypothetical protein
MRRPDRDIGADLIRIGMELQQPPTDLSAAIMRLLATGGSASGADFARILCRRRTVVLATIRQLAAEGKIRKWGSKWEAVK